MTSLKIPVVLRVRPLSEKEQKDSYQVKKIFLTNKNFIFRHIININI